jgi:hypothetical protein
VVSRIGLLRRAFRPAVGVAAAAALALVTIGGAQAAVIPGTPGRDVHKGLDNDNAQNTFIQPPGVTAKQHLENTDVIFGRGSDDLLIGKLGSDVLSGNEGHDILIGGREGAPFPPGPNSDVLLGDWGSDINIWAPGDGSEVFVGDEDPNRKDKDSMVFAPFVLGSNGKDPKLVYAYNRTIPRVDISAKPQFTCKIEKIPAAQKDGAQFVVRFLVNGNLAVTVRQKDVEQVFCPSPTLGKVNFAYLDGPTPTKFKEIWINNIGKNVLGAILAPPK